jgi:hypothetical protein
MSEPRRGHPSYPPPQPWDRRDAAFAAEVPAAYGTPQPDAHGQGYPDPHAAWQAHGSAGHPPQPAAVHPALAATHAAAPHHAPLHLPPDAFSLDDYPVHGQSGARRAANVAPADHRLGPAPRQVPHGSYPPPGYPGSGQQVDPFGQTYAVPPHQLADHRVHAAVHPHAATGHAPQPYGHYPPPQAAPHEAEDAADGSPLMTLFAGLAVVALAIFLFVYFSRFEAGEVGSRRMWWPIALAYNLGGKWPPTLLIGAIGGAVTAIGLGGLLRPPRR